ncbi:hypothetical protein A3K55_02520 [Candidatus Shapirobacteria bacterium RBG_13_44_7]|uniref:DUF3307 domain-containing protein n=1 Tax=Candidatus Shapirobacteria bacterium RBG_13_44_7 TaxID=1802149 RepID=A0A1F7SJX4_9BACT|nr:MAG: hypothetical protein A3K55_02520 [Candidatus Shapirobacteria bacterium RBG_13_44_7]
MHWIYAHFIGDYIIQNDWMANNKKSSPWPAMVHALVYLIPFLFCPLTWWQILFIGLQHYIQDRSSFVHQFLLLKGSAKFASAPYAPWSLILTDNIFHILWIALVASSTGY